MFPFSDFAKNPHATLKKFWSPTEFMKTSALQWGIDNEENAAHELEVHLGGEISRCGLFVSKMHYFIGASPDGIFQDFLIEIKCPFILRHSKPNDFSKLTKQQKVSFCCTLTAGKLKLKKSHKYYGQIMCQMYVTGYKKTIFMI